METKETLQKKYDEYKAMGLKLNMARGLPGYDQLKLSEGVLNQVVTIEDCVEDGVVAANYGNLSGMPSAKKFFAEMLDVKSDQVFVGGNASLLLMFNTLSIAYESGLKNSVRPWKDEEKLKFLCPTPGYDRHFRITEKMGFELITIPMTENGPDMDIVEEYIKDPAVKGMWNVPKYSNPQGIVYSDEVIDRIAKMKPAAPDFLLMWDNAYCVHEFDGDFVPFKNILAECEKYGNADMPFEFASTSKLCLPGNGISCFACSEGNMEYMLKWWGVRVISFDKVNQIRHVKFLKDKENLLKHMKKHGEILKPKFDIVLNTLEKELGGTGLASWTTPKGGYFVSVDLKNGLAKKALALAKDAGVTMTGAGAAFPYGIDPNDSNVRIAPTFPPCDELQKAIDIFCLCVKLASVE